jgi:2-polyprenyl-3-methyl-5-hydroxy-6-metoxy-1,4-benzoquinol methylase
MRLSLRGANPAEWLALRAGLVPTAAAEAWGGMATSGVLVASVRTGITARLAAGPATAAEVAADLGLDPLPARLLLDCLRSAGHVTERSGRYQLGRRARRWLDPASPLSVAGYVAGAADYWPWWQGLEQAARSGTSTGSHEVPAGDPYWRRYIEGQLELARLSAAEIARKLPLPRRPRAVLDIGGGHGWYSATLCRRYPELTATVLDLPGSAAIGREIIAAAGLADRVVFRAGDATTADLGDGYDAVLCFNLVHHLAPAQVADLLRRARAALRPGGTLAVLDVFADRARRAPAHADLLALFVYLSSGAQVHTSGQFSAWLSEAGFGPQKKIGIIRVPGLSLRIARNPR